MTILRGMKDTTWYGDMVNREVSLRLGSPVKLQIYWMDEMVKVHMRRRKVSVY